MGTGHSRVDGSGDMVMIESLLPTCPFSFSLPSSRLHNPNN
jgi:hypothetical protein